MKEKLLFLLLILPVTIFGQNLVQNPDFEDYTSCPLNLGNFWVVNWHVPTVGTSDYHNACGGTTVDVPSNQLGTQESQTGSAYAGYISTINVQNDYREYFQSTLASTTVADECYELKIIYSHADQTSFSDGIEMYLSNGPPSTYIGSPAQLSAPTIVQDKTNWITLSTLYVSTGNENTITVGNFRNDYNTQFLSDPGNANALSYQYVDYVSVRKWGVLSENISVDLGPDIELCEDDFPVTITTNHPTKCNYWGNGEFGNSIEVMDPGVYYLTVVENCEMNFDSIVVEIATEPDLELEEDQLLCEGETYTIVVDGSLGTYTWPDGSNGTEYTVSEPGTYDVDLQYLCGVVSDEIVIDFLYHIEIEELPDLQLCTSDLPYEISLEQFDTGTNIYDWSDGTSENMISITAAGTYDVHISNSCFEDRDTFSIEIDDVMPFEIPFEDQIACEDQDILIFTGLTGADLIWLDGSTENYFLATGPGTYILTASNNCGIYEYQFVIDTVVTEILELGDDLSICPGDSVELSGTNGEFLDWDNGDSGTSIWATSAGAYIATLEGQCQQVFDTIILAFDGSAPVLELPDSILLCGGDSILLEPAVDISGIEFDWNIGSSDPSITVSTGGLFVVSGSNNCGEVSDSVYITLGEALPMISFDAVTEICPGDTLTYQFANANAQINWSTGSSDTLIKVSEEGKYWLDVANSCGSASDTFEVVLLSELTQHDLGQNLAICQGDSVTISGPTIDGTYLWNTLENTESIVANLPGTYWLEISNNCSTFLDSVVVEDLGQGPNVSLGADVSFCLGDTVYVNATGDFIDIAWNNGPNTTEIPIFNEGIYIAEVSNVCGIAYDTIEATLNLEPPSIEIGEDQSICPGDSVLLDVGNVAGNILWSNGSEEPTIYADQEGLVTVSLNSSCGTSYDSVFIELLDDIPPLDLGQDQELCIGEVLDINLDFPVMVDIEWQNGDNSPDQQLDEAGLYWVEISNDCGITRDSIELSYTPAIGDWVLPPDELICDQSSFTISPNFIPDNVNFLWNTDDDGPTLLVTESGTYSLTISNNCETATDEFEIEFGLSPSAFDLGSADTLCQGESITLDGDQGPDFNYQWQDGNTNSSYEVLQSGSYSLDISNICGLESAKVEILVLPDAGFEVEIDDTYLICEEDDLLIDLANSLASQIIWNDGTNDLEKLISSPGNYFVELFNDCRDTLITFVLEKENCITEDIFIPNAFTPNEDGINDFFSISYATGLDITSTKISIYNRWGELMFYSEDPDFQWYGDFKNNSLNPGVYVYILELEWRDQDKSLNEILKGDIALMK